MRIKPKYWIVFWFIVTMSLWPAFCSVMPYKPKKNPAFKQAGKIGIGAKLCGCQ